MKVQSHTLRNITLAELLFIIDVSSTNISLLSAHKEFRVYRHL